ncbi:MAG TPA: M20 family metallopeptidase [Candidatus Saccharimonadales bacterium]
MNTATAIETIKQLLAIPSTADNPEALAQAVDFMATFVAMHVDDVTIERFESNGKPSFLAYRGDVRPAKFDVLLNAHLDVVPGAPDQFKAVEKNGRLYGRGAFDMKAAAVVESLVFCELVHDVPFELGLQIVSDEEIGGFDCALYQIEQGVRADFILTGEHTLAPNIIYTAARGLAWAEIAFKGKTAHGGYPWRGRNALLAATEYIRRVLKRYPTPAEEAWTASVNVADIETGNQTFNAVPDNAVIKLDFRFTPEAHEFATKESFEQLLFSFDPNIEILDIPVFDTAISVAHDNLHVQALARALEQTSGTPAEFGRRFAGGDSRHFTKVGGHAVEFGLTGGHMHGSDEYVDIAAIDKYRATLRRFLRDEKLSSRNERIRCGGVKLRSVDNTPLSR